MTLSTARPHKPTQDAPVGPTPTSGIDLHERRFHLDEDVLPGAPAVGSVAYLNHGRQIARNRMGQWICAATADHRHRDRNWLMLWVSDDAQAQGSEFPLPITLVGTQAGPLRPLFTTTSKRIGASCVVLDRDDRLHVFYEQEDGLYCATADASGASPRQALAQASHWTAPRPIALAGSRMGDALLDGEGTCRIFYTREQHLYALKLGAAPELVCEHVLHPSVHLDDAGVWHLAFERDRRTFYLRRQGDAPWTDSAGNPAPEQVAYFCTSWPSIATTTDGKVVIAYQGEGKVDLKANPLLYPTQRPGAGGSISYAVYDGETWRHHDLIRSQEILLKRAPTSSLGIRGEKFQHFMEELWRPSLAIDRHGVLWLFYLNSTRRHVYWSRFQGECFGERHEARGAYDQPSRVFFVQKDARRHDSIGTLTLACNQLYFDFIDVPAYASSQRRRVLFLDNLEVDRATGLEHCLGVWRKQPRPIFGWGITSDDPEDNFAWCQVHRRSDGFELHYMGMPQGSPLRSTAMPGRAFSPDGLHWEKRPPADLSDMTLDGGPFPNSFWRPIYLEDPQEPDPQRRYKGLWGSWTYDGEIQVRMWLVVVSPDGRAWRTLPELPRVIVSDICVSFHLLRDEEDRDPRRRYKVSMLMGCHAGRAVVIYTSPDLIHWSKVNRVRENPDDKAAAVSPYTTGPIAIDPDAAENPWEEEVHDGVLWRDQGLLMLHYDAFYFGANQHIQKALAISRDGRHYWRVKRGAINMPNGAVGDWDSGRDRTSPPLRVGDELWLYFCGMPAGFFVNADAEDLPASRTRGTPGTPGIALPSPQASVTEQRPWRLGLAKLRVDGWAYFQLQREAQRGELLTIPLDYSAGQLVVNGTGLGDGLRVEICDADTGRAVEGFDAASARFSAADAVSSVVTWSDDRQLAPGRYRLRFAFTDLRAKLYAFGFEAS